MEVSNRTILYLVIVALVVSAGGTIMSLNKLSQLQLQPGGALTGFATGSDTGIVNLSIPSEVQCIFTNDVVDFGTGTLVSTNCTLTTTGIKNTPTSCTNFNTVSTPLVLENNGTEKVLVNLSSNVNAATFLGGSTTAPQFRFNTTHNNSVAPCALGYSPKTWTDITVNTNFSICNLTDPLDYADNNDSLGFDFLLNIPNNAPSGQKAATITAYCES